MVYETVFKIPDDSLLGEEGKNYLRKKDIETLEECNLLYFLKRSNFHILHDTPVLGAMKRKLISSTVTGPYEYPPKKNRDGRRIDTESYTVVLELVIPTSLMPVKFDDVSLVSYGTVIDRDSIDYLRRREQEGFKIGKINELGDRVLKNLRSMATVRRISKTDSSSVYRATIDGCLLELELGSRSETNYPKLSTRAFGKNIGGAVNDIGIRELDKILVDMDRYQVLTESISKGLAHDLSLKGIGISKLLSLPNIVI